ncbi:MAG TPA: response regulator transcription factor [Burkholderiaceae bacterium]|nr:response regulator transcription factor [Burkholderiaceae bacterium]
MPEIIVIEPHALLRLGISECLADVAPGVIVKGIDRPPPCPSDAGVERKDVVLMSVGASASTDLVRTARDVYLPTAIILMSEQADMPLFLGALPSEVRGYLPKQSRPDVFRESIRLVLAGGTCFPLRPQVQAQAALTRKMNGSGGTEPARREAANSTTEWEMLGLTPRQYEVLVLLARGHPLKTVSRRLNISLATAKSHTESVYQRLDVSNRNAAVYAAVSRGAKLGWPTIAQDESFRPEPQSA